MYIACHTCRRQYDIGDLPLGSRIRCHCGDSVEVPEVRARDAEVLHCSSCGAHLKKGAETCSFCGSTVSDFVHHLGPVCPECFARMIQGAEYCSGCGVRIATEKIHADQKDWDCPRCNGKLVQRLLPKGSFTECVSCGGIWLEDTSFERLVDRRDETATVANFFSATTSEKRAAPNAKVNAVKYIPCPVCGEMMHRKNFAGYSGVIIDWCKGHGYWFDVYELENILEFVEEGGMDRARDRDLDRARHQIERARWKAQRSPTSTGVVTPSFDPDVIGHHTGLDIFDILSWIGGKIFKR